MLLWMSFVHRHEVDEAMYRNVHTLALARELQIGAGPGQPDTAFSIQKVSIANAHHASGS